MFPGDGALVVIKESLLVIYFDMSCGSVGPFELVIDPGPD